MAPDNTALGGTAFTVSIDLKGRGVTTGISAHDRAQTIRAAVDPSSRPDDFGRPGHVFPLRARDGGVLERRGQTEASVDLARLAGLYPAGVICEILNDDGTMCAPSRSDSLLPKHGLVMITVADLARYRLDTDDEESLALMDCFAVRIRQLRIRKTTNNERKQMSAVQTLESKAKVAGNAPVGRLFVLDLSGNHVFSINPDGSGKKTSVTDCRSPMASRSMSTRVISTGPTWAIPS